MQFTDVYLRLNMSYWDVKVMKTKLGVACAEY